MIYYIIQIETGEWEDTWIFPYKNLYFTSRKKADTIKMLIDPILEMHNDLVGKYQIDNFPLLDKLDSRFWQGCYNISSRIKEVEINIV